MAERFHELKIAGCTRQLPILNLSDTEAIAAFIMLGDVELAENCAKELAAKVPLETEIIVTAETKGIPLAEELSRLENCILMPHSSAFAPQYLSMASKTGPASISILSFSTSISRGSYPASSAFSIT